MHKSSTEHGTASFLYIHTPTFSHSWNFKLKMEFISVPGYVHNMIFAHIFLPAILFAICKAQPYPQSFTPNNDRPSMEEYRHLILNSVAQMKNSCRVYDYLLDVDKKWTDDDAKLEGSFHMRVVT